MSGGEIYIPIIPSIRIIDLAKAMAPKCKIKVIVLEQVKKFMKMMCPNESYHLTLKFKDHYLICPSPQNFEKKNSFVKNAKGEKVDGLHQILNIVQIIIIFEH